MIEDFIKYELNYHKVRYNLRFSDEKTSEILNYIKKGVYAFQLIYNENQQVILVKPLDWTKVVSTPNGVICSYDGGKHFKYSSIETLKIDVVKIRELKLDSILTSL
jgi:hypothetical protein